MTDKPNVTSKYEQERLRAAEQSQIVYLQGQIDELRRLLKEQTNKYNWVMEQMRKTEANVAQIEGLFERHRQEIAQSTDGSRRDIAVLRKEIASALVKLEETSKPLREMQTQIHQLSTARKQDRDEIAGRLAHIEELEQRALTWQSQIKESEERHRALAGQVEALYAADEGLRAEIRKFGEALQIEKQSLRRQAVEAQQLVADVRAILDDHHSRLTRLDEIRQQLDLFTEQLPSRLDVLEGKLPEIMGEVKRVERLTTERFLMNQERLEELRNQQDEKMVALQEADEQQLRQLSSWLERVDSWVRELEQRLVRANGRLDELQREHGSYLDDLNRRNVQLIDGMATTLREQLEQIKAEQVERGRTEPEQDRNDTSHH